MKSRQRAPFRAHQQLTPKAKRKVIQFVVDYDDYQTFRDFAESLGWSTSSLARRAITPYIENAPEEIRQRANASA